MITRCTSAQRPSPKQDFLNPSQRKELKRKLLDKFTKLYGLSCPSVVSSEIEKFFSSNIQLNSKTLSELEKQIRSECIKHKTNSQKLKAAVNSKGAGSNVKFEEPVEEDFAAPPSKKVSKIELDDDEENEEFNEVAFYKNYLAQQEKDIENKRKILQQKSVRAQLNMQITQKCEENQENKKKEELYAQHEQRKILEAEARAEMMATKAKAEKQKLLEMQHKILEERTAKLALEKEKEKALDLRITTCLKEDLSKAKADAIQKAADQKMMAAKMMQENEERKKRKVEQESQQRKEEKELQNIADKIAIENEERRNAELKNRSDKINSIFKAGENMVNTVKSRKDEEEARLLKYWKRKNEQTDKKEAFIKEKEKENKILYRQFLDKQIKERKEMENNEKAHINQQANIWATDVKLFAQNKEMRAQMMREEVKEYKETLDSQIRTKQERDKKPTKDIEAEKDELLTKIKEMEDLKQTMEARLAIFN